MTDVFIPDFRGSKSVESFRMDCIVRRVHFLAHLSRASKRLVRSVWHAVARVLIHCRQHFLNYRATMHWIACHRVPHRITLIQLPRSTATAARRRHEAASSTALALLLASLGQTIARCRHGRGLGHGTSRPMPGIVRTRYKPRLVRCGTYLVGTHRSGCRGRQVLICVEI